MPNDGKIPITVRIPASTYNALVDAVSSGVYPSQTAGVITSLEHDLDESKIIKSNVKIIELQDTIEMQSL
jgi:Arc/MetJ-type ribon-helix-helix transcriptional regulator